MTDLTKIPTEIIYKTLLHGDTFLKSGIPLLSDVEKIIYLDKNLLAKELLMRKGIKSSAIPFNAHKTIGFIEYYNKNVYDNSLLVDDDPQMYERDISDVYKDYVNYLSRHNWDVSKSW